MKKNRKNSKGYMLVEIILASTIAFALAYFMLELTLKLKEKNDDLLVATLMATDKTIISNKIMSKVRLDEGYIPTLPMYYSTQVYTINDKKVSIYGERFEVNKYAFVDGNITTFVVDGRILHINVPLRVKAKPNDGQYEVDLYYLMSNNNG